MHKRTTLTCLALTAALLVPLSACGARAQSVPESTASAQAEQTKEAVNTDPRKGWVVVATSRNGSGYPVVYKICDGTTLVFATYDPRGGIAVIENSPECTLQ